ncbi:uncharacterized protein HGUI_00499 [Hanseniaspora guilliermondii]|uniref:Uncharacterized protein n=1 Tax=Hanseniaspora guilliermondii TaxID=56406 RepID=A0A1L0B027_9ASCO|nr:uncharacterized protein HGUI_00499 [Hanseniaspora guilliermondii]
MSEVIQNTYQLIDENKITQEQLGSLSDIIKDNKGLNDHNQEIIAIYDHIIKENLYLKSDENDVYDLKQSQDLIIKPLQLFIYNTLSNDTNRDVTQAFDVYLRIFKGIDMNSENLNIYFLIDMFKSLLSLMISTYLLLISSKQYTVIKNFYNVWSISDKLLKNLDSSDDLKKKKLLMSLEYLINKYFNLISMEVDTSFDKINLSLSFFNSLVKENPNEDFYLKLLDNYLLFNIDNVTKEYVAYINEGKSLEDSELFKILALMLSKKTELNKKLIDQIFTNFLQTIISNLVNENINTKPSNISEQSYTNITVRIVMNLLLLYKFDEPELNDAYLKIIFNIVNDLGYTITEQGIWSLIFGILDKDIASESIRNIFKTILTTDDIMNNLDFKNIKLVMDYTNTLIMNVIDGQSDKEVIDDKILLNLFNYYWNVNDYLNQSKEKEPNLQAYYDMWEYLFNKVLVIFDYVCSKNQGVTSTIVLNLYFNLINSSIVSVDSAKYTTFIKEKTVKQDILTRHQEFIENHEVMDLLLKETSAIINSNVEEYALMLTFYQKLAKKDSIITNEVYFVVLKNYNLFITSFVNDAKDFNDNRELKDKIYEIWLSFDLSLNNELIINEIKPNNKSLYDLNYEYMKMFPSIELLGTYDETALKVIEKCIKFPILPSNNGKDENNVTMLQRICFNNLKMVIEKDKFKDIGIEIISNILSYKTELNKLILDKIFSKIPEKLIYRLPTFKKISSESLVYMAGLFKSEKTYELCMNNEIIKGNLFKLVTQNDESMIEVDGAMIQSYLVASNILLNIINKEGYGDTENIHKFLTMFKGILENIEKIEVSQFILGYKSFSSILFTHFDVFQNDTDIYNQLSKTLVRLIVNKNIVPIYDIFSNKLMNKEEFSIDDFDPDNLWIDLYEQSTHVANASLNHKSLDFIKEDINQNKPVITKEKDNDLLHKFLQLNDHLNKKYI